MKLFFYPRLAWTGIRKNSRLYTPYLCTCIGMVAIFTIFMNLNCSPVVKNLAGGSTLTMILSLGTVVIWFFALLFLSYTSSFLLRRRKREFGLYNVLGMGKGALTRLIVWENLFVALFSLTVGMFFGLVCSKAAELGLCRFTRGETDYTLRMDGRVPAETLRWFAPIFLLLFFKSLFQVGKADSLELLSSESYGEKPPKANYLLALAGAVLLAIAYAMAVSIDNPLAALLLFFVAVILVILATYLLFISGSVALCRGLQKNKRFYYKKNHFVSVSTMVYRMKRNGAGLASICILSTMVLVMLTTTVNLYLGSESMLHLRNIRDNSLVIFAENMEQLEDDRLAQMNTVLDSVPAEHQVSLKNTLRYRYETTSALMNGSFADITPDEDGASISEYGRLYNLYFVSQQDYNQAVGTHYQLEPGTALACDLYGNLRLDTLNLGDALTLGITQWISWKLPIPDANTGAVNSLMLVIPDYETMEPLAGVANYRGDASLAYRYVYAYDCDAPDQVLKTLLRQQVQELNSSEIFPDYQNGRGYTQSSIAIDAESIYGFTGGMLFLGLILSLVFLLSAALIIYYKQISEGFEDQARFEILQKVGMTRQDIRKSINSQVLTVFFAPLLAAGTHLAFAYPMLQKLLQLFGFLNGTQMILITLGTFLVFCGVYAVIYKATASAYFTIVSGGKEH